ncbi:hypothetical protein P8452_20953 [Trifolium repens]|nr:hypothetical protein P8452_20953 [Trifolium repens]
MCCIRERRRSLSPNVVDLDFLQNAKDVICPTLQKYVVQKIEKSSSSSGKAESFVTSQKEQMTSENVNKEEQNANKIGSQVESR